MFAPKPVRSRLRTFIILILAFAFSLIFMTSAIAGWVHDYDTAASRANETGKLVLAYFSGSDWCRPCIKLKSNVLETEEFRQFAGERFVILLLDFPVKKENALGEGQQSHNEALAEKYNHTGAFPLLALIDPADGKMVGQISGYSNQDVQLFIEDIEAILP